MRRSLTAYENRRNDIDPFRISPLTNARNSEITLKRDTERVYTQANASWGKFEYRNTKAKALKEPTFQIKPKKEVNKASLCHKQDIQNLLDLLKTTDFIGKIDPEHHSNYVKSTAATTTDPENNKTNNKNDKETIVSPYHSRIQSDGQLLAMKK